MPELPEVEFNRHEMERFCRGHKITKLTFPAGFDDIIMKECESEERLRNVLGIGVVIEEVTRKGKQLYFIMPNGVVVWHMGMTGAMIIQGEEPPEYKAFKVHADEWPPRFTKLELTFSNGCRMAFCDPRRLGRMKLCSKPADEMDKLALDPLLTDVSAEHLALKLAKYNKPIKALLLEQDKVVCGIGNWVADEVLFRAGVHPSSKSQHIASHPHVLCALASALSSVVREAAALLIAREPLPQEWLFHHRWGKGKSGNKLPDGRHISFETIGGRSAAFIKSDQRIVIPTLKVKREKIQDDDFVDDEQSKRKQRKEKTSSKGRVKGTKPEDVQDEGSHSTARNKDESKVGHEDGRCMKGQARAAKRSRYF